MNDTNVGLGMVPHKPLCRCAECRIERLEKRNKSLITTLRIIAERGCSCVGLRDQAEICPACLAHEALDSFKKRQKL